MVNVLQNCLFFFWLCCCNNLKCNLYVQFKGTYLKYALTLNFASEMCCIKHMCINLFRLVCSFIIVSLVFKANLDKQLLTDRQAVVSTTCKSGDFSHTEKPLQILILLVESGAWTGKCRGNSPIYRCWY